MRWEYLTQSLSADTPAETLNRQLNELGAQGWELVAATDKLQLFFGSGQTVALVFIFKRAVEEAVGKRN
jgi:hypothetical protein